MSIQTNLKETIKALLLPMRYEQEEQSFQTIVAHLKSEGITEPDQAIWLMSRVGIWKEENTLEPELKKVIEKYLEKSDAAIGPILAEKYFELHQILMKDFRFTHQEASSFLSYSFLILDLAKNHSMASSQISNVLLSQAKNDKFTWDTIKKFLQEAGERQDIDENQIQNLFAEDSKREERELADADLGTSIDIVAEFGQSLGFPGDLKNSLWTLYEHKETVHGPYLQILHYICSTAHFFDNALSYLYEYGPRGKTALWLFSQYLGKLDVASGNAVLNNAKSVYRLDINWANSKKNKERYKAREVVFIVEGLEKMRFSQRKELVGWIRLWLHRIMRLHERVEVKISTPTEDNLKKVFEKISQNETNTKGILEQRITDAFLSRKYPKQENWHPRGLGDSVNASNSSRKKFGDCEFLNPEKKEIISYEVHAGKLNELYIKVHVQSIKKVLELRKAELESIADLNSWKLRIIFVAHEITEDAQNPQEIKIDELRIELRTLSFVELFENFSFDQNFTEAYTKFVIDLLNDNRTPHFVREAYSNLIQ